MAVAGVVAEMRAWFALALLILTGCGKEPTKESAPTLTRMDKAPVAQPAKPPPKPDKLAHVTIKALGMYCEETCPMKVRYALADIEAVYELGFDISNEAIFVSYDATLGPAKQVTAPMIAAIKSAGFDPWLSKEEWPADVSVQVVLR